MRLPTIVCVILTVAALACAGDDTPDVEAEPATSIRQTELKWTLAQAFAELNDGQGGYHPGEDWNFGQGRDDIGKPVHAIFQGEVVKVSELRGGLGGLIIIRHASPGGQTFTVRPKSSSSYSYSEQNVSRIYSVYVHIAPEEGISGETVERGEVIGKIADLVSVSPHLHFEVRLFGDNWSDDGSLVEPDRYWAKVGDSRSGYYTDAQEMVNSGLIAPSEFVEANRVLGLTEPIGTGAPVVSLPPAETIRPPQVPAPSAPSRGQGDVGRTRSNPIPLGTPFRDDEHKEITVLRATRIEHSLIIDVSMKCLRPTDVTCVMLPTFFTVGDSGLPGNPKSVAAGLSGEMYGGNSALKSAVYGLVADETGVVLGYRTTPYDRSKGKTLFVGLGGAVNPLPGSVEDPVPLGSPRVESGWIEMTVVDLESTLVKEESKGTRTFRQYDLCVTSRFRYVGDPSLSDGVALGSARLLSPGGVRQSRPLVGRFDVPGGVRLGSPEPFAAEVCFENVDNESGSWKDWLVERGASIGLGMRSGLPRTWSLFYALE